MRFIQSAGATVFFRGLTMACGLAVSIIVSRVLGPGGRGIYGLVMTILVLSSGFGIFGFATANTYFVARNKDHSRAVGFQSIGVGLLGFVISAGVLLVLRLLAPDSLEGFDNTLLLITLMLIPIYLWGHLFSRAYLGLGRIVAYNLFESGARVLSVAAAILVLAVLLRSLTYYFSVFLVAVFLMVVLYVANYFRISTSDGKLISAKLVRMSFSYGARSWLATVFTWLTIRSGIFFVNYVEDPAQAGLFSVAQQISELLIVIPSVIGALLTSRVAAGDTRELTPRVLRTLAMLLLLLFAVLALSADWIIGYLFGQKFLPSVTALRILLPGAFLLGLEVVIAGDIAGRGYPWRMAIMWVPVFVLNALGYVILVPSMGINGAALSTSLAFVAAFVYMTWYLKKLTAFRLREMFIPTIADIKTLLYSPAQILGESGRGEPAETGPSGTETQL